MYPQKKSILIIFFLIGFNSNYFAQMITDELVFSHQRGFYENAFSLTIELNTPGALIKFTKDGTNPFTSPSAQIQSSPASISIDPLDNEGRDKAPGIVLRACAVLNDRRITRIETHTYLFLDHIGSSSPDGIKPGPGWPDPNPGTRFTQQGIEYGMDPDILNDPRYQNKIKDALLSVPTFSLVTDLKNLFDPDTGIYSNALNRGRDWERCVSVELLNPDESPGFQIDAGIRIRGGFGRTGTNFKHAFRLFFRNDYGYGKLDYPLFGDEGVTEFHNIDLRTAQNYSWAYNLGGESRRNTMLREVFSRDTQRDMGQPYTRSKFYHLYINGTYWGLYQTQERSEASYGVTYFGGPKEDYDVIKINTDSLDIPNYQIEATDGNLDAYRELWEIASDGFSSDESYYRIQGLNLDGTRNPEYPVLLDVDNLIDYMLCTIYVADPDAPIAGTVPNNFYAIYKRSSNRGFLFFRHDGEHGLMFNDIDITLSTRVGNEFRHFNPRWLHQQLCFHPGYRMQFYDRIFQHFFRGGALTYDACRERLLKRKEEIDLAIIAESSRWGDTYSEIPFTKDDDWLPGVNWILDEFIKTRTEDVVELLKSKDLYPDFDPIEFNMFSGMVNEGVTLEMNTAEGEIYYTLDGNDTYLSPTLQNSSQKILVARNAAKLIHIPSVDIDKSWRNDLNFDDNSWISCSSSPGGIGYDLRSDYDDLISCDLEQEMYNVNSSCMIRIPFEVTEEQLNDFNYLILRVQYNDGFVTYLNRRNTILSANFSGGADWNSTANAVHEDKQIESFDISSRLTNLQVGTNLLSIQAFNSSAADSNFFFSVELIAGNTMKSSGPVSPSAILYTEPIKIDETSKIKARVYKDDQWSALNQVFLRVSKGYENLTITEIHYHPLDEAGNDDNDYEFLELKNIGDAAIELSGITFTDGIHYHFPTGATIDAGAYIVLASDADKFEARYNFAPFGEYTGQLANAGEEIEMASPEGKVFLKMVYDDNYPWPNSADGSGYSLIRKPHRIYNDINAPGDWCASQNIGGNPGGYDEVTSIKEDEELVPLQFRLSQNYPNPFNPSTTIEFTVNNDGIVKLNVFDITGQKIRTLVSDFKTKGKYRILWNGTTDWGIRTSSGVYFYQLLFRDKVEVKKAVLLN